MKIILTWHVELNGCYKTFITGRVCVILQYAYVLLLSLVCVILQYAYVLRV